MGEEGADQVTAGEITLDEVVGGDLVGEERGLEEVETDTGQHPEEEYSPGGGGGLLGNEAAPLGDVEDPPDDGVEDVLLRLDEDPVVREQGDRLVGRQLQEVLRRGYGQEMLPDEIISGSSNRPGGG